MLFINESNYIGAEASMNIHKENNTPTSEWMDRLGAPLLSHGGYENWTYTIKGFKYLVCNYGKVYRIHIRNLNGKIIAEDWIPNFRKLDVIELEEKDDWLYIVMKYEDGSETSKALRYIGGCML